MTALMSAAVCANLLEVGHLVSVEHVARRPCGGLDVVLSIRNRVTDPLVYTALRRDQMWHALAGTWTDLESAIAGATRADRYKVVNPHLLQLLEAQPWARESASSSGPVRADPSPKSIAAHPAAASSVLRR